VGEGIFSLALACTSGLYGAALAGPYVEFDFARAVECHDITPPERLSYQPHERLIEVVLPVSVRFHGLSTREIDELNIEINGASAGLRVLDFAPCTQLASDICHDIETTTTTNNKRSFDGTLGGTIPVPAAEIVSHVTPSITTGVAKSETATQKIKRLPPKKAVIVSGTLAEGRGVFFKMKPWSQTSLEGVHDLAVTFIAPARWQRTEVEVTCSARGQKKMLWIKQDALVGGERSTVRLVLTSAPPIQQVVLKPVAGEEAADKTALKENSDAKSKSPKWRPVVLSTPTTQVVEFVRADEPSDSATEDTGEPLEKSD
jgi:hypothetical protein